jgi:hypothetical protein
MRSSLLLSCPCLTDREGAINDGKWQALAQEWHDTSRDLMAKIEAAGSDKTAKAEKNKQLACVFVRQLSNTPVTWYPACCLALANALCLASFFSGFAFLPTGLANVLITLESIDRARDQNDAAMQKNET